MKLPEDMETRRRNSARLRGTAAFQSTWQTCLFRLFSAENKSENHITLTTGGNYEASHDVRAPLRDFSHRANRSEEWRVADVWRRSWQHALLAARSDQCR